MKSQVSANPSKLFHVFLIDSNFVPLVEAVISANKDLKVNMMILKPLTSAPISTKENASETQLTLKTAWSRMQKI